tara:strand:- start:1322 stop:2191 length:870 start_codon:yes stop_codon:yes gene_type:complete
MANGGYNPFTFATGLTQLRGQRGLQGMVSGVQDKYQDLESIKDYIRQSGAKIGDVLAYGGRTDVQAKLGGLAGTAALKGLGMKGATAPLLGFAIPHAALLAGLGAGLYSYFRKKGKQKDISNLASLAPKVKYGMSDLKEAVSDIDEMVSSTREGILPSALSTGINVPLDVLKMQLLKDQFGKLSAGVGEEVPGDINEALSSSVPVNPNLSDYANPMQTSPELIKGELLRLSGGRAAQQSVQSSPSLFGRAGQYLTGAPQNRNLITAQPTLRGQASSLMEYLGLNNPYSR